MVFKTSKMFLYDLYVVMCNAFEKHLSSDHMVQLNNDDMKQKTSLCGVI